MKTEVNMIVPILLIGGMVVMLACMGLASITPTTLAPESETPPLPQSHEWVESLDGESTPTQETERARRLISDQSTSCTFYQCGEQTVRTCTDQTNHLTALQVLRHRDGTWYEEEAHLLDSLDTYLQENDCVEKRSTEK